MFNIKVVLTEFGQRIFNKITKQPQGNCINVSRAKVRDSAPDSDHAPADNQTIHPKCDKCVYSVCIINENKQLCIGNIVSDHNIVT